MMMLPEHEKRKPRKVLTVEQKRFKVYEKKYRAEINERKRLNQRFLELNKQWPTRWPWSVRKWTRVQVAYAVYEAQDCASWHIFRAALKGITTTEKIFLLMHYAVDIKEASSSTAFDERLHMTRVRIDNYLGVLTRSGQLSTDGNYTIIKE